MVSKNTEIHPGIVLEIEDDYTLVALQNKSGQDYQRYFDTPFLKEIGIEQVGDQLEITFSKHIKVGKKVRAAEVVMRIVKTKDAERIPTEEVQKILAGLDMKKIREKFPPIC